MNQETQTRSILKVSELNAEVNHLMRSGFPMLWVEGEISNLAQPSSGHLYFSLKDDKAQVRCAMFKNRRYSMTLKPENGLKILARAKVGLYEPRGDYQLIVEEMEDAGIGQLQKAYEALKKKLANDGLFDDVNKKQLPQFPHRIGIITSPSGAAIRDIVNVLNRRAPHIKLRIYPVAVQGDKSAPEIIQAIRQADNDGDCDVILLARGGGSIEDLWSFNDEVVALTIHDCQTPIVSGVGHEIDFTIADFVSDQRAPTPSAAAELVSPDTDQLIQYFKQWTLQANNLIQRDLRSRLQHYKNLSERLSHRNPNSRLEAQAQRVDELEIRLQQATLRQWRQQYSKYEQLLLRLKNLSPAKQLPQKQQTLNNLQHQLRHHWEKGFTHKNQMLSNLGTRLQTLSPLATLDRGYSITLKQNNVVRSVSELTQGDALQIQLHDGKIDCEVTKTLRK